MGARKKMESLEQELAKLHHRASTLTIADAKYVSEQCMKREPSHWVEVKKFLKTKGLLQPCER